MTMQSSALKPKTSFSTNLSILFQSVRHWTISMISSILSVPSYLSRSRAIIPKSRGESMMNTFAAILSATKYGLTDGSLSDDTNEVYKLRSAMT